MWKNEFVLLPDFFIFFFQIFLNETYYLIKLPYSDPSDKMVNIFVWMLTNLNINTQITKIENSLCYFALQSHVL